MLHGVPSQHAGHEEEAREAGRLDKEVGRLAAGKFGAKNCE